MALKKPENNSKKNKNNEEEVIESKNIPIEVNEEQDSVQIDFQEEDSANAYVAEPTKPNKDEEQESIDPNTPVSKIQEDLHNYEQSKSGVLEFKDLLKQAEFLITLFDTAMSMFFKWLAKDSSTSAYSMPASNKKILTEQLALILAKYQTSFKVEYRLFAGLLILYSPMAIAAVQNRKKQTKKPNDKKIILNNNEKENIPEQNEIKKQEDKPLDSINVPFKRKRGAQPKV